ncbi:MAG TPA: alpha/beta family hydrolase [Polyangia bacterium]|nr:alpha/beta family hydrolase [Polyangia bacterium]
MSTTTTRPFFLLAPGAGAPSSSAWMQRWHNRLSTLGEVMTLDYPYMLAGRRRPDPPAVLIAAHAEALAQARLRAAGTVVLIGKSMGGRIGCHVAVAGAVKAGGEQPDAGRLRLVCLGYPLKSASSGALRDEVLVHLTTPVLFVQGTRDPLCPLPLLEGVRARMSAPNLLHVVEGGDHSLEVSAAQRKRAGISQGDSDANVLEVIRRFVTGETP